MMAYVKFSQNEWIKVRKAALDAQASCVEALKASSALVRLKRNKRAALNELRAKLKELLSEFEKLESCLPKQATKASQSKQKHRTKYDRELEAIKKRIEKLSFSS